jgi:hypothetical protein
MQVVKIGFWLAVGEQFAETESVPEWASIRYIEEANANSCWRRSSRYVRIERPVEIRRLLGNLKYSSELF